jgi:hypothetical protein
MRFFASFRALSSVFFPVMRSRIKPGKTHDTDLSLRP